MSANNKLKIIKRDNGFVVRNIDMDTGYVYDVATTDTLEKAIEKANEWGEENVCEYGLDINFQKKKLHLKNGKKMKEILFA